MTQSPKKLILLLISAFLVFFLSIYLYKYSHKAAISIPQYAIGENTVSLKVNFPHHEQDLAGFNEDLLLALQRETSVIFTLSSSQGLLEKLKEGSFDGVLVSLEPSPINQKMFVFSEPYFALGPVLILPNPPLRGLNEFTKKIVGIQTSLFERLHIQDNARLEIKVYNTTLPALKDLNNHTLDAAILPLFPTILYIKIFYPHLKITSPPLINEGLRLVALNKPRGIQLVNVFNKGLVAIKKSGEYQKLLEKWGWGEQLGIEELAYPFKLRDLYLAPIHSEDSSKSAF